MLEITIGRTWTQNHTVYDSEDPADFADLSHIVTWKSQIRTKSAVKDKKGKFQHALIVDVTVMQEGAVITQTLTRIQTAPLPPGEYLIDLVGIDSEGNDEAFLEPEPIKVTNRPTLL